MVKPPGVCTKILILLEKGQAGAPKWWSHQWRVRCRRGLGIRLVARASGCTYIGAAAMLVCDASTWEVKCVVQDLFVACHAACLCPFLGLCQSL